jgi:hypothetical protein
MSPPFIDSASDCGLVLLTDHFGQTGHHVAKSGEMRRKRVLALGGVPLMQVFWPVEGDATAAGLGY